MTAGDGGDGTTVPRWRLPVQVTVTTSAGYDENASTTNNQQGSVFTSIGVGLNYHFGTSRTLANLSTGTGFTYNPDLDSNKYDPDLNLSLTVAHQVNLRLTVNLAVSALYRSEPDFSSNLTVDRRAGNYFSSQDSISASYQWLPRFSTVTSYSLATVQYDNDAVGFSQDRFDHSFTQSLRFLILPITTFVADYSVFFSTYDGGDRDSHVQSVLVGFDHSLSARLHGSIRAGAEFRSTDNPLLQSNDGFSPHADASLSYIVGEKTSLSWSASYGTQESYVENTGASVTFRTGLAASYAFTPKISGSLSGNYQHNENQGPELFPGFSFSFVEDSIDLALSFSYAINRYFSANAGYGHTEVDSDFGLRSYSRNRYFGGLSVNF